MTDKPMLTAKEVARRLAVTTACLAQWRNRRKGPAWVQAERAVRYPEEALEHWIAERTTTPAR